MLFIGTRSHDMPNKEYLDPFPLIYLSSDAIPIVHMPVGTSESQRSLPLESLPYAGGEPRTLPTTKGQ